MTVHKPTFVLDVRLNDVVTSSPTAARRTVRGADDAMRSHVDLRLSASSAVSSPCRPSTPRPGRATRASAIRLAHRSSFKAPLRSRPNRRTTHVCCPPRDAYAVRRAAAASTPAPGVVEPPGPRGTRVDGMPRSQLVPPRHSSPRASPCGQALRDSRNPAERDMPPIR